MADKAAKQPRLSPEQLNRALVETLKADGELKDPALEAAFLAVPRHLFLPDVPVEEAYQDKAIPIKTDPDGTVWSSSSQPGIMAIMLRQLKLRPGDNVLEIGTGAGYNAAVMQHLVGEHGTVTTVELDPQLAAQAGVNLQRVRLGAIIHVVTADGALGYAPRASYDRIVGTAAAWDVPPAWPRQLKPGGVLVVPIWLEALQVSAAFTLRPDSGLFSDDNVPCGFVPMRGISSGPAFWRRISSSALIVSANEIEQIDSAAVHALLSDTPEVNYLGAPMTFPDMWRGFPPYLTLNLPEGYAFALYSVGENQVAFGLEGSGYALIAHGSACFVPYRGDGLVYCFGGADAFMSLSDTLNAWDSAGRPSSDRLRLRLVEKPGSHASAAPPQTQPPAATPPTRLGYKVYSRLYHDLHVWLED